MPSCMTAVEDLPRSLSDYNFESSFSERQFRSSNLSHEEAQWLEQHSWTQNNKEDFNITKGLSEKKRSVTSVQMIKRNFKSAMEVNLRALEDFFAQQEFEEVFIVQDGERGNCLLIPARGWQAGLVNNLLWLAAMWSAFFAPLSCGFGLDATQKHLRFHGFLFADWAIGILYALCAIVLRLRTSIVLVHEEVEIISWIRLARMTFQSWTFWFDLVSLFPLLLTDALFDEGADARRWFPLVAMLRTWRLISEPMQGIKFGHQGWWNYYSRVVKLLSGTVLVAHIWACCWFLVVEICGTLEKHKLTDAEDSDLMYTYGIAIVTGAGILYQLNTPEAFSNGERYFQAVLFPTSAFIMAVLFAELVVAVSQIRYAANRRHENMTMIHGATAQLGVNKRLKTKMLRYQHFLTWHYDVKLYQQLISSLSQQLHLELKLQLFHHFIKQAVILHGLDQYRVQQLVMEFDEFVYCPGDLVVVQGEVGEEMFFIVKGTCQVLVGEIDENNVVATKHKGDYFGEICLLFPEISRSAHVRAASFCVIAKLTSAAFNRIIPVESTERIEMLKEIGKFGNVKLPSQQSQRHISEVKSPPRSPFKSPVASKGAHTRPSLASLLSKETVTSVLQAPHMRTPGTSLVPRSRVASGDLSIPGLDRTSSNNSSRTLTSPLGSLPAAATGFCISPVRKKGLAQRMNSSVSLPNSEEEVSRSRISAVDEDDSPGFHSSIDSGGHSVRSLGRKLHQVSQIVTSIQRDVAQVLSIQNQSRDSGGIGSRDVRLAKATFADSTWPTNVGYFNTLLADAVGSNGALDQEHNAPNEQREVLRLGTRVAL